MTVARSLLLFALAALAEVGGAYGFVATFQPDPRFGRILAAHDGVFGAGSLAWGVLVDKFRPDRWDYLRAAVCLVGVSAIMYAPRR
ncbi:YnfA family protein [Nocardia asiatica]|uniref:YnfA family protein n=1 Tax=Nocardia asiatica TaxID=209252 RepID=UPI0024575572|nr:YnfA family protein [Nocardia asiatica]